MLSSRLPSQIPNPKPQNPNRARRIPNPESPIPGVAQVAIALALSGFAALGMEILWFRHFSIMLGAFRAVFSLLLTVILVGIGAGALVAGVLQRYARRPAEWLIAIQALFIVFTLLGMAAADSSVIDRTVSSAMAGLGNGTFVERDRMARTLEELWFNLRPILLEVALPALLMGFAFPLANAVIQRAERSVGRRAGVLYLANTAGAVAGSLVAGFLLLPTLGLQASATVLMLAAALGLIPLHLAKSQPPTPNSQGALAASGSLLLAVGALVIWWWLPADYVRTRALPQPDPNEGVLNQSEGV